MTARDPAARPPADAVLASLRGTVLPEAFYSFAHGFFGGLRTLSHEQQVRPH